MFEEPRLSVLKIPRRQHAGKASVENVDLAFEKEQTKIRAKSDALNSYEYNGRESKDSPLSRAVPQSPLGKLQSPMAAGTPVRIFVDASTLTPTAVPEEAEVVYEPEEEEHEEEGSAYPNNEAPSSDLPAAGKHTRIGSQQLNLFSTEPVVMNLPNQHNRNPSDSLNLFRTDVPMSKPLKDYKVQPPFATHDEKAKAARHTAVIPPYATAADNHVKSTKKSDPISFPWQWQEEQ